jgi:hypothetical protein
MAVILCPGDATDALGRWAVGRAATELDRIAFYEHGDVRPRAAYAGWLDARLPSQIERYPVRDFKEFVRLFGQHLNQRILEDFRPRYSRGPRSA